MVSKYALPVGQTFGLEGANGVLYTFGSDAARRCRPGSPISGSSTRRRGDERRSSRTEFFDGKGLCRGALRQRRQCSFLRWHRKSPISTVAAAPMSPGSSLTSLLTFGEKMYGTSGSVLYFSNIDAPSELDRHSISPNIGAGFKNMANQSAGSESLTALGKYQNFMAVFARRNTQIWSLDVDASQHANARCFPTSAPSRRARWSASAT
jgi:hypothetical protein